MKNILLMCILCFTHINADTTINYSKFCTNGHTDYYSLALAEINNTKSQDNDVVLTELFRAACKYGDERECNINALNKMDIVDDNTFNARMLDVYRKSCNAGCMDECFTLSAMYLKGDAIARDYSKSIELATKACSDEYTKVCALILYYYQEGIVFTKDANKSFEYKVQK